MDFVGTFSQFPIWKIYRVKLYLSIKIKLKTYELLFLVVHNSHFSSTLYKLSKMQVYQNNGFYSIFYWAYFSYFMESIINDNKKKWDHVQSVVFNLCIDQILFLAT